MSADRVSRLVARLATSRRAVRPLAADVVRLDNGDPNFNTPEAIRDAHGRALSLGKVHYAHPQGDPELRAALASGVSGRAGRTYGAEQMVVTHGASGGLAAAILATVDPGDMVLLPEPTYSLYADLVNMAGGRPTYVATRPPRFHLDVDALERAAPGARLLILCNPCNPTGAVYARDELEAVARLVRRHDLLLIADEAYDHIVYEPRKFTSLLEIEEAAERLIYLQTFSKTFAMTGWRIGYVAAPPSLAAACARVHRAMNGPLNSAVQAAAITALAMDGESARAMLDEYMSRRTLVIETLADRGIDVRPPEGTFYVLVPHSPAVTSVRMAELAAEAGVAVRAGTEYGPSAEGFVRAAFSASRDEVRLGLERLATAIHAVEAKARPSRPVEVRST